MVLELSPVLEVRTYQLLPGAGREFDGLFREGALPLLHRFGIHVVGYGTSVVDDDRYILMRAYPSASRREEQLQAFYGSDEWRESYETLALSLIESYQTVVIALTPSIAESLASALPVELVP